jgi:hypothetical protein
MTAATRAATPAPILHTASGEPPLGAAGEAFRPDQGEMLLHHNEAYRSPSTRIGVIELNNGKWLSFPFGIDRPQFDSREAALRSGIAAMVRKARKYMRNGEGQGTHWSEGYGRRVIEWALSLKPSTDAGATLRQGNSAVKGAALQPPVIQPQTQVEDRPARPDPLPLLTAKGRAPVNSYFACHPPADGEWHIPEENRLHGIDRQIGLLELNNGNWMSHPDGLMTYSSQFPSRESALRSAIAKVICYQRSIVRDRRKLPSVLNRGDAPEVIAWALSLKPEPENTVSEKITPSECLGITERADCGGTLTDAMAAEELTIAGYAASDTGSGLSDPVVRYLVDQHALRKQFPAKHIFSMTTDIADGRVVSVATCACRKVFKFGSNDHLRMNAAIEAHWRRFAHEKTVDGRGQPIGNDIPAAAKKPKRETKSNPDAGGLNSASVSSAPSHAPVEGADVLIQEPAQICAPAFAEASPAALSNEPDEFWDSPLIKAAIELAWRDEVSQSDPVKEFEVSLPTLMGPEERRRRVTEFKLALKQKPVNLGPLFGDVPPPRLHQHDGRG